MKKKHYRQLLRAGLAYLCLFTSATIQMPMAVFGAASGNYTDLLPIGAAENTTVISRGTGWALTTLPASQTFGDALSRSNYTAYQATGPVTFATTATVSTFTAQSGQGKVGSTTFPYLWVATGRTIRVTVKGFFSSVSAPTWTWAVKLGTTTIVNTGAVAGLSGTATKEPFSAVALMTINATGSSGSISGQYEIRVGSTSFTSLDYSTYTTTAVSCDLSQTSHALVINPTFKWGTSSGSNSITANNILVEFLN